MILSRVVRRRTAVTMVAVLSVAALIWACFVLGTGVEDQSGPTDPALWGISERGSATGAVNTAVWGLSDVRIQGPEFTPIRVIQGGGVALAQSEQGTLLRLDGVEDPSPVRIPLGADRIQAAGHSVVLLNTTTGRMAVGTLQEAARGTATEVPIPGGHAVAAAMTSSGTVWALSERGVVYRGTSARRPTLQRVGEVPRPAGKEATLTVIGERWAVLLRSPGERGRVYLPGSRRVTVPSGGVLPEPDEQSDALVIGIPGGGMRIVDGRVSRLPGPSAGTPATPIRARGCTHLAWTRGTRLWVSSCGRLRELRAPEATGLRPVFVHAGEELVLWDARAGLIWRNISPARWSLIAGSTRWHPSREGQGLGNDSRPREASGNECPALPEATRNRFGIRAGQTGVLAVLAGATDPNRGDALVVQESPAPRWAGLDLGRVEADSDGGGLLLQAGAQRGTSTLVFHVSDIGGCSVEASAEVTVLPSGAPNTAPEWRVPGGVEPDALQLAPGGTATVNGLLGWADPEADALMVDRVRVEGPISAVASGGQIRVRAREGAEGSASVTFTVRDPGGQVSEPRTWTVEVRENPELVGIDAVRTVPTNRRTWVSLEGAVRGLRLRPDEMPVLSAVQTAPQDLGSIRVEAGAGALGFFAEAAAEGSSTVLWQIRSGSRSVSGRVRLLAIRASDSRMLVSPLLALVPRDREMVVDPLSALRSRMGPNLFVAEELEVRMESRQGWLEAQTVSGAGIRVMGDSPNEEPALLGTVHYTVSDGVRVLEGVIVASLGGIRDPLEAVAAPDFVTVRAGELADIPVLENDLVSGGGFARMDPSWRTEDGGTVAFPTATGLRYLAGSEPGVSRVDYRMAVEGRPEQGDVGTVFVRVLPTDASNSPPTPHEIVARVPSGGAVDIPPPGQAEDPEGDRLRFERILDQRGPGAVQLGLDGALRVVSAGAPGVIVATVQVSDGRGGVASVPVRVVVLGEAIAPIAFTDLVETDAGRAVTADLLGNDVAAGEGTLLLRKIDQIRGLDGRGRGPEVRQQEGGRVTFIPTSPGRFLYEYEVESPSGATARARIHLVVSPSGTPPHPVIPDLHLRAGQLLGDRFAVDVLSDGVLCAAPEELSVAPVSGKGVRAQGPVIRGTLRDRPLPVVFRVSAPPPASGERPAVSFGVLFVPARSAVLPELRDPQRSYSVREGETVRVEIAEEVLPGLGEPLEVLSARPLGRREGASCTVEGTRLRYETGSGSASTDACAIETRWRGNPSVAVLLLSFRILLRDPSPVLLNAQIAVVDPGASREVSLEGVLERRGWDGDLSIGCDPGSAVVRISCSGSTARVSVAEDARQGSVVRISAWINRPARDRDSEAIFSVRVGTVPSLALQAETVVVPIGQREDGSGTGEGELLEANRGVSPYRPVSVLPGSVQFPGVRVGVAQSGGRLRISVPPGTPSGLIRGFYTLVDAQGNRGTGILLVQYRARPAAPVARLQRVDATSVTVALVPGDADDPPTTAYELWVGGGERLRCAAGPGVTLCRIVLSPNRRERLLVRAVSSLGRSLQETELEVMSYSPPAAPDVQTAPHPERPGWAMLRIRGDASTEAFLVDGQRVAAGAGGEATSEIPVSGTRRVAVSALSDVVPLPAAEMPDTSPGVTTVEARGIPIPNVILLGEPEIVSPGRVRVQLTVEGADRLGEGISGLVGAAADGSCRPQKMAPAEAVVEIPVNREVELSICARVEGAGLNPDAYLGAPRTVRVMSLELPNQLRYAIGMRDGEIIVSPRGVPDGMEATLVEAPTRGTQRARFRLCLLGQCGTVEAVPDSDSLPYAPTVVPAEVPRPDFLGTTDAGPGMVQITWAGAAGAAGSGRLSSAGAIVLEGVPEGLGGRIVVQVRGLVGVGVLAQIVCEL